jgi:hypothetical protein
MHCLAPGKDKCTSIYGVGHMPMTHPNGDKGFLPLAGELGDASSPSPAADAQTSDVTNDAISARTTMRVIAIGLLLIALLECSTHRPGTVGI